MKNSQTLAWSDFVNALASPQSSHGALQNRFVDRHLGPRDSDIQMMLKTLSLSSLSELVSNVVPEAIRMKGDLKLAPALSENAALDLIHEISSANQVFKSYMGMGYSDCFTPPVILRNILENPGWYTQYTPYQAEIAQGRLEALLNFQTMIIEMTGLEIANASLLDEATAAAEAMHLCFSVKNRDPSRVFWASDACHPQTLAVLKTRAEPLGIRVVTGDVASFDFKTPVFGVLLQYPDTMGRIQDYRKFVEQAHAADALVVMAADLLSLCVLKSPGELGADIAIGSTQRFGVPMGYGGPHAAYFSTKDAYKRVIPGRIVGVSEDVHGKPAIRLALQTREQHIRRDKATSNICTAQVLLAVMASMYAVYHGPEGLADIAVRTHLRAVALKAVLKRIGFTLLEEPIFDTLVVCLQKGQSDSSTVLKKAWEKRINLREIAGNKVGISVDETTGLNEIRVLAEFFSELAGKKGSFSDSDLTANVEIPVDFLRQDAPLRHPIFSRYHSETEMLRYMTRLQTKDLSLTHSMIPLGSCTMKLNATAEMIPVTWPEFGKIHPFAPLDQTKGYQRLFTELEKMLAELTGFAAVSLQPNAGSQGEYAGLLVIREYHRNRNQAHRNVCLIPKSAHGTNPASAAMAGMKVVVVDCDDHGNVDLTDLRAKAEAHKADLSALMVTYPSTHGVFEEGIKEVCQIIHSNGGQVYMDGANMNAQIGLCRPGEFGPDVCHLNLHKTFCIPHGGGGPGMGPIGVAAHLKEFLPGHPVIRSSAEKKGGAVSAAPWGSASILPISWMYIAMMGADGLKKATEVAILNANYIAERLSKHYPVLYRSKKGWVAHECIFECRPFKESAGIDVEDIAKRLMDYGFHAPTISFPVAGTLMVEPTESESKEELDRFCEAMISIREEIREIETGKADRANNVLKNAPHTAEELAKAEWTKPYSREKAAFPNRETRESKFWPAVGRINNVLGDRNLVCSCPSIEEYES